MFTAKTTNRFEASLQLCIKRRYDIESLKQVVRILLSGERLPKQYRDHKLQGNLDNCRECHIKPDWLLIYRYDYEQNQI